MRAMRASVGWVLIAGMAGCGSSGGSGVSDSRALSELDEADWMQLCEEQLNALAFSEADLQELGCILQVAIEFAFAPPTGDMPSQVQTCEATVDTCLQQPFMGGPDSGSCDPASSVEMAAGCDATVADFRACFAGIGRVSSSQVREVIDLFSCQELVSMLAAGGGSGATAMSDATAVSVEDIPECQELVARCPDALQGMSMAGGAEPPMLPGQAQEPAP